MLQVRRNQFVNFIARGIELKKKERSWRYIHGGIVEITLVYKHIFHLNSISMIKRSSVDAGGEEKIERHETFPRS